MNTIPLFPATTVGSLPRSPQLQKALAKRQAGKISEAEFTTLADDEVVQMLQLQLDAGADIVTDGEQRRDNFYSFIAGRVRGVRLMNLAEMLDFVEDKSSFERLLQALDVPAFAIKNPIVEDRISREKPLALEEFLFLKQHTAKPIKVALPGPYLLTRSMWVKSLSAHVYPNKESLGADVVKLLREELTALRDAGCFFVQFDEPVLSEVAFAGPHATHTFMCAALSEKASPELELSFAVDLINAVVDGIDGIKTGLHVCRGNWSRQENVLLSGAYDPLIPYFARMHVRQFVLEYAADRAGSIEALQGIPDDREIGLGVCNPRTTEIESTDSIVANVRALLRHRGARQIYLNPDCGFGTFADRPVSSRETAAAKIRAVAVAAARLRESVSA